MLLSSRRSPVLSALSTGSATLLLFLSVPLLATSTPSDQYGTPAQQHHHGNEPSKLHRVKLQNSGYQLSQSLLPLTGGSSGSDQLLSVVGTKSQDTKILSRNVRNTDKAEFHRVKLTKSDYKVSELLTPLVVSQTSTSQKVNQEKVSLKNPSSKPLHELQVGCADGSLDIIEKRNKDTIQYEGDDDLTIEDIKTLDVSLQNMDEDNNVPQIHLKSSQRRKRETEENIRQKRDFIRWYETSAFHTQPSQQSHISSYQISSRLPYFIPIWGNPARIPVYFPYKPILFNPGYPVRNPPNISPIQPGTDETNIGGTTEKPGDGQVVIGNRINVDRQGNPIWGIVEPEESPINGQRPFEGSIGGGGNTGNVPVRPRKPATPPLLHRPSITDNESNNQLNTPPPSLIQAPVTQRPQNFPQNPITQAPSFTFPNNQITSATNFPPPVIQATVPPVRPLEPSRCVWAVISCCSPLTTNVRYNCFEQLGCSGAFWDRNPCSREITTAALNAAQRFYEQSGTKK